MRTPEMQQIVSRLWNKLICVLEVFESLLLALVVEEGVGCLDIKEDVGLPEA